MACCPTSAIQSEGTLLISNTTMDLDTRLSVPPQVMSRLVGDETRTPLEDSLQEFRREARLREFLWRKGEVRLNERIKRSGHNPGLILFTGEKGTGKARLGRKAGAG